LSIAVIVQGVPALRVTLSIVLLRDQLSAISDQLGLASKPSTF